MDVVVGEVGVEVRRGGGPEGIGRGGGGLEHAFVGEEFLVASEAGH